MKRFTTKKVLSAVFLLLFFVIPTVADAAGQCFYYSVKIDYSNEGKATKQCRSDMTQAEKDRCEPFTGCGCILVLDESHARLPGATARCMENKEGGLQVCDSTGDISTCKDYLNAGSGAQINSIDDCVSICSTPFANGYAAVKCTYFRQGFNSCEDVLAKYRADLNKEETSPVPESLERGQLRLPDCAYSKTGCRNINALLELVINIGDWIFGFIGGVALLVFVYGGFVVVTSFGNAEKVKKGYSILGAALIGMAIAVSAYLLVDFLLDALTVKEEFRSVR
ncbi:hypothetical protein H6758_02890 [Candidatus Nomurabacteria bacterium]|nr:hypothetical protein [Candidatus Nomurabacteria bacterium]